MNLDKCIGCILMVGIGDAMGVPFETMTAEEISYLELIGYDLDDYFCPSINPHPFPDVSGRPKGSWSDDTQLTCVTMESIIEADGEFNMDILARRHREAYQNQDRRGWGRSTKNSCARLLEGVHWTKSGEPHGKGNGVMIKIAPLALREILRMPPRPFYLLQRDCINYARMTHGDPSAIVAGYVHAYALSVLLACQEKITPRDFLDQLHAAASFAERYFYFADDTLMVSSIIEKLRILQKDGSLFSMTPHGVSMQFGGKTKKAFWALNSFGTAYAAWLCDPNNFNCMFDCIRMGGDTDSNAAIAGSLLGALNGRSVIPQKFIDGLEAHEYLEERATVFYETCTKANVICV